MYSGHSYTIINRYYRGGATSEEPKGYGSLLANLDSAFKRRAARVPSDVEVLRFVSEDHPLWELLKYGQLTEGVETQDLGYMSTSIHNDFDWEGRLRIRIKVPKGTPAIYLSGSFSHFPEEKELLLNRGTRLRVTKVSGNEIQAEVVPK
jgi:hypothetical protein